MFDLHRLVAFMSMTHLNDWQSGLKAVPDIDDRVGTIHRILERVRVVVDLGQSLEDGGIGLEGGLHSGQEGCVSRARQTWGVDRKPSGVIPLSHIRTVQETSDGCL